MLVIVCVSVFNLASEVIVMLVLSALSRNITGIGQGIDIKHIFFVKAYI